jgi:hypothetical protein
MSGAVRHYVDAGWRLVAIPPRSKRPIGEWQTREYSLAELELGNVGVRLGEPSGWLVDVDLDSAEAIVLADQVFPRTLTFGRASKPRSHRLYTASGAATRQFRAPDGQMIVELRSTGAQTVLPGSVHESGEPIEWDDERDSVELPHAALSIDAGELLELVAQLAVSALIMRQTDERTARKVLFGGRAPPLPGRVLTLCRARLGIPEPERKPPMRAQGRAALDGARANAAKSPPAISGGGGHATTFRLAQHLVHGFGLDDADALAVLDEWNATCQPPWSPNELAHKIGSARQHPVREPVADRLGAQ